MSKSIFHYSLAAASIFCTAAACHADSIIYATSAGNTGVQVYDANTGVLMNTIDTTEMQSGNGRGVVKVGDILYYTEASSNTVYGYNLKTSADLGKVFTAAGSTGLATMAYDGTNFYLGDYSGTNNVYKYTPTGTLLQTIPLSKCTAYCDGLEYAQGHLISNEADGAGVSSSSYDVYTTNGSLLKQGFITPSFGGTGIAFDGTDYWVSDIFGGKLYEYDTTGKQVGVTTLQSPTLNVEDLSFDYKQVLPPPMNTPEPSSVILFSSGLTSLGLLLVKRRRQ